MRIKSKDIAKELGISPATVSLVLNNRPGVNEKTRQRVLDYVQQKEMEQWIDSMTRRISEKGTVLMINYIKNGVIMEQNERYQKDFIAGQSPMVKKIAEAVIQRGYSFRYRIFRERIQRLDKFFEECRELDVKGIYILAAEMVRGDIYPFRQLKVPIVVGDNLFYEEGIDSYLIDNKEGIARGVNYLLKKGHRNIVYLAENISIYNFEERREAFIYEMIKQRFSDADERIWYLGSNIEEVYENMSKCLDRGIKRTTAFMLESSVISLGVSKALMERGFRIPRDISLIGFDALPPSSLPGIDLTLIKGTHTKRHLAGVIHLMQHMEHNNEEIMKVYYRTRLLEGNSVFDKAKYIYR